MADEKKITFEFLIDNSNYKKGAKEVEDSNVKMENSTKSVGKSANKSFGTANYAVTNFNRVIQDAAYFGSSFSMGILAIGNNLDPLAASFVQLSKESGGAKGALMAFLGTFTGPQGVLTIISLAVSAFTYFSIANKGSGESAEDLKKKLDKLKESFEKLTDAQFEYAKSSIEMKMSKVGLSGMDEFLSGIKSGLSLSPKLATTDFETQIEFIAKQLLLLEETKRDLGVIENIQNRITINEEKRKKLNENPVSKNYFAKLVPGALSYADALSKINSWLEADQQKIEKPKTEKEIKIFDYESEFRQYLEDYDKETKDLEQKLASFRGDINSKLLNDEFADRKNKAEEDFRKNIQIINELKSKWMISSKEETKYRLQNYQIYMNSVSAIDEAYLAKQRQAFAKASREKLRDNTRFYKDMEEKYWGLSSATDSIAYGFGDSFKEVLHDMLGDANSVFEKIGVAFVDKVVNYAMNALTGSLFSWFLNLILPGAGLATGWIGGGGAAAAGAVGGTGLSKGLNLNIYNSYDTKVMELYNQKNIVKDQTINARKRL